MMAAVFGDTFIPASPVPRCGHLPVGEHDPLHTSLVPFHGQFLEAIVIQAVAV